MKINKNVSKQGRKQRRARAHAPLHVLRKTLSAPLAKELRAKAGRRSAIVTKGAKVKVLSGRYRGVSGTVTTCDSTTGKIAVDTILVKTQKGTENKRFIPASSVVIIEIPTAKTPEKAKAAPTAPAAAPASKAQQLAKAAPAKA